MVCQRRFYVHVDFHQRYYIHDTFSHHLLLLLIEALPRSNKHGRKRLYTEKYDGLHVIVLRSYISVSYTETYGDIRRKKQSFTVWVHGGRIQSPFSSVYNRTVNFYGCKRPYTECVNLDLGNHVK